MDSTCIMITDGNKIHVVMDIDGILSTFWDKKVH